MAGAALRTCSSDYVCCLYMKGVPGQWVVRVAGARVVRVPEQGVGVGEDPRVLAFGVRHQRVVRPINDALGAPLVPAGVPGQRVVQRAWCALGAPLVPAGVPGQRVLQLGSEGE